MQPAPRRSILLVARGLDPVGTGRQVDLVARGLAVAGWDVHVAFTSRGGSLPGRLAAAGIPTHRLGRRPEADAAAAVRLVGRARSLRPAAILAFGRRQAALVVAARFALPGVRIAAQVATPVLGRGATAWLARLDRVIATSPEVAAACRQRGVPAARLATVAPGIVADEGRGLYRVEIAARLGLNPETSWTLCVAPLVAESRLDRLLWGIDQLSVVHNGLEHVLVGAGPQLARLRRRARVQELAERLCILPHCDLLPDLLGQVRFAWQSGESACGGVLLDAMARGVPVVAVASDAARQLIADGETGRVVPAVPESEFPRRAFGLLEDDALSARFGAAGRVRAAERFPVEPMVAAYAAVLEGLR
jgi:glycosyltransferase involved in cell wall biosynthesis